jgi:hypothetical protein
MTTWRTEGSRESLSRRCSGFWRYRRYSSARSRSIYRASAQAARRSVVLPVWRGPQRKKVSAPGGGGRRDRVNMNFIFS